MTTTIIPDHFTNFALSQIASGQNGGALQPTDTVFSLRQGDGALYPQTTPFTLVLGPDTINPEIIQVTAINRDVLTITRAQEGTTAQLWPVTTLVQQTITAGNMTNVWNAIQQVLNAIPIFAATIQDNPTAGAVQIIPNPPSAGTARALELGGVDSAGAYHVGITINSDGTVQGLAATASVVSVGSESAPTILVQASPVGYATLPTVKLVDDGTFILRGLSNNTEVDFLNFTPSTTSAFAVLNLGPLTINYNQLYSGSTFSLTTTALTPAAPTLALAAGSSLGIGAYHYVVTYRNQNNGETTAGTAASITTTSGNQNIALSAIPTGPYGTVARRIYRTLVGGSTYHLLTTLNDNTTTTYSDSTTDSTISAAATPPSVTSFAGVFQILNPSSVPQLTLGSDGSITSLGKMSLSGTLSTDGGAFSTDGAGNLSLHAVNATYTGTDSAFNTMVAVGPSSAAPLSAPGLALASGTTLGIGAYQYVVTYYKISGYTGETNPSPVGSITTTSGNQAVTVTLPQNPAGLGGRKLYRTSVGGSTFKLVATISDNTTTTYTDTVADASLGVTAPTSNTFGGVLRIVDASGATQIRLSPSGNITATGAVSFDNGSITSDGHGNLVVASLIGSASQVGGHTITVGKTAPTNPALYDVWIQTSF